MRIGAIFGMRTKIRMRIKMKSNEGVSMYENVVKIRCMKFLESGACKRVERPKAGEVRIYIISMYRRGGGGNYV